MRYHIVPTYRCNLKCEYCYSKNHLQKYGEDMSLEDFKALVTRLLAKDLTSVSLIGGEPTVWTALPAAIDFLHENGLKSILYSNGILATAAPRAVILNMTRWAGRQIDPAVLANIEFYRSNQTAIVFRCNIQRGDTADRFKEVLKAAYQYQAAISVAALDIQPADKAFGKDVYRFCRNAFYYSNSVDISRPLPICMFSDAQYTFLQQNCGMHSICNTNALIPLINPDGETFYPCNSLREEFSLRQYLDGTIRKEDYSCSVERYHRDTIADVCKPCPHFLSGACHCGCFIDRG